jgi:hypothetical protein
MSNRKQFFFPALLLLVASMGLCCHAANTVTIQPTTVHFGTETVGLKTVPHVLTLSNNGDAPVMVTSLTLSPGVFQLCQGLAPFTVKGHTTTHYTLEFAPTAGGDISGTFTVNLQGLSPLNVSLMGTGATTGAIATVTPSSIDFGNVKVGAVSQSQTVTVKNTGTSSLTVLSAAADPPFSLSLTGPKTLSPGQSFGFPARFFPAAAGPFLNTLTLAYDVLPANGVDLTGTGVSSATLEITTFPTLPVATQAAPYSAPLGAAGGKKPYSFRLQTGSSLPKGLTLSSTGTISGTLDSSVGVGTSMFSVQAKDSSVPPTIRSKQMTLTVAAPTGADCNMISKNVAGTNTPLVPLDILATGTYLGEEGGLYPNGSNLRPTDHDSFGVGLAAGIQPLDANGNPDPNGKYVLLALGESDTRDIFNQFIVDANADPSKNSSLVVVNGAQGNGTAGSWIDPNSAFWNTVGNNILPNSGVTSQQVVAAWIQTLNEQSTVIFPDDALTLQSNLQTIAQNLLIKYPNIKLAYFSSRAYAGYSDGIPTVPTPEPTAYNSGFGNKWAIADQLDGDPELNFDPSKGPVLAPWMSWGPYYWTNGLIPGTGGLVWTCQDMQDDGFHPSIPAGAEKAANALMNFFKTDDTTAPWFVAQ